MKKLILILLLFSMISGNYASNKSGKTEGFNQAIIQRTIKEVEGKFIDPKGDFKSFERQVWDYQDLGIILIPVTENLVRKYLNTFTDSDKDSVYVLFDRIFYKAVNDFNNSLESRYSTLLDKRKSEIDNPEIYGIVNPLLIEFKRSLDVCGLTLLNSEGTYYVDANCDYYYNLFKDKVSPALTDYLKIRKKELNQGFSEDAELLISFHQLYERVLTWEDFTAKYPDFFNIREAQFYYASYLSTLITGMDNSQPFYTETGKLLPELRKLYLKITKRDDSRKSTNVIKDYYELLRVSDFSMPADLDQFLKDNELYSMNGVEPDTR